MGRDWKETNSYMLTSGEVEKMLADAYGDKLHPVDEAQMARQRRNQTRHEEKLARIEAEANDRKQDDQNRP
jgi:hypothetical protein